MTNDTVPDADAPADAVPAPVPAPPPRPRVVVPPPAEFADLAGRRWAFVLDRAAVARVRENLGVDLAAWAHQPDGEGYGEAIWLALNADRLRDVLWTLVGDEPHARGVDARSFFAELGWGRGPADADRVGEVLDVAGGALIVAIADRWPDSPFAAVAQDDEDDEEEPDDQDDEPDEADDDDDQDDDDQE